jgi:hypothetical protein
MVMWHKADVNNNGTLEGKEATAYLDAIRKNGKKYEMKTVGQLSSTEFMAACKDDAFKISFYRVQAAPAKAPVSCSMRPMKEWPRAATRASLKEIEEAKARLKNSRDRRAPPW